MIKVTVFALIAMLAVPTQAQTDFIAIAPVGE